MFDILDELEDLASTPDTDELDGDELDINAISVNNCANTDLIGDSDNSALPGADCMNIYGYGVGNQNASNIRGRPVSTHLIINSSQTLKIPVVRCSCSQML